MENTAIHDCRTHKVVVRQRTAKEQAQVEAIRAAPKPPAATPTAADLLAALKAKGVISDADIAAARE